MKIQLERKLTTCPERLRCTVCDRVFKVSRIRTLLYNDRGFIQGEICPKCMQLKAEQIKQKLRDKAMSLMEESGVCSSSMLSTHELALELLESSTEDIKFPTFYQWSIEQLKILTLKPHKLEAPKPRLSSFRYGRLWRKADRSHGRSRLRIFFEDNNQ